MGLCAPRGCGCAITSTTLDIDGSGTPSDPWNINTLGLGTSLPIFNFATTTERDIALTVTPAEPQFCWIRNIDTFMFWDGTGWRIIDEPWVNYTPVLLGAGWTLGTTGSQAFGRYRRQGRECHIYIKMTFGTGATFGALQPSVSLPSGVNATNPLSFSRQMVSSLVDATGVVYNGRANTQTTQVAPFVTQVSGGVVIENNITNVFPMPWTVGDWIEIDGWYEIA